MSTSQSLTHRDERVRGYLVILLAITSGSTDAIGFLGLGGAFTSVMTGNLVLLGLSASEHNSELASHSGAAIAAYIVGVAIGTRFAGRARSDDPHWPRPVTVTLALEFAALLIFAIGWEANGAKPTGSIQLILLLVNAIALGMQSAAIQRFGNSDLSTTYLTGTLTRVVSRLVLGSPIGDIAHSVQILCGLVFGAAAGAMLQLHAPHWAPLIQLGTLGVVLVVALTRLSHRDSSDPAS
jgi:uncharacterized membrane protein YoaK (UPF0700 family)